MTTAPPRPPSNKCHSSRLVQHDVRLTRQPSQGERAKVVASVHCERRDCETLVEACARCARFARIEPHEAGYVLLCRAEDETIDSCADDCAPESEQP